jgi:hypothetical protein
MEFPGQSHRRAAFLFSHGNTFADLAGAPRVPVFGDWFEKTNHTMG